MNSSASKFPIRLYRTSTVRCYHRFKTHFYVSNTNWRRGVVLSGVRRMNEVTLRRARLVLGWVTVFGRVYHFGM